MNAKDIIALANAGYNAQQIAAIAQVAYEPMKITVPAAQVAPDVMQQITAPAAPAPAAPVPAAPVPAAPVPAAPVPAAPAPAAPAPAAPAAPAAAPQQLDFFNQLLGKIDGLTTTMRANAIMNSQQPAQPTEQDILAEIICPPPRKE